MAAETWSSPGGSQAVLPEEENQDSNDVTSNVKQSSDAINSAEQEESNEELSQSVPNNPADVGRKGSTGREGGAKKASPDIPEHFMFETKYVLLNFMSLVPPDLYKGHIIFTPDSVTSGLSTSDNFTKSQASLSKSQSFDASLSLRHPKLKQIGKLRSFQREIQSPSSDDNAVHRYKQASEDNLSYRYRQNVSALSSYNPAHGSLAGSPHDPSGNCDHSKSSSTHSVYPESPLCSSPHKTSHGVSRMYSDVSSSGDFSYMGDADDEYEDLSNASSIFSSTGKTNKDAFLDLRKSAHAHRMPTLLSQSEVDQDDIDGRPSLLTRTIPETSEGECDTLAMLGNGDDVDVVDGKDFATDGSFETGSVLSMQSRGDRTKLKLEIPCQPLQLDDILVSLQTELNSGMSELETEYEDAVRNARDELQQAQATTPAGLLTPQTEAARILARIGDEVKDQYGPQISAAVNRLYLYQLRDLTYQQFYELSQSIIDTSLPGWRQVALLMVYEQNVLWNAVKHGNKQLSCLVDYCSQFVADVAAEFIIKEGGWGAVMNFDPSQSSDSVSSLDSPAMLEYFTRHNVTQVPSEQDLDHNGHSAHLLSVNTDNVNNSNNQNTIEDGKNRTESNYSAAGTSENTIHLSLNTEPENKSDNGRAKDTMLLPGNSLLKLDGGSMYKPSLGFDFRDQPSPFLLTGSSIGNSISYVDGAGSTAGVDQTLEDVFQYPDTSSIHNNTNNMLVPSNKQGHMDSEERNQTVAKGDSEQDPYADIKKTDISRTDDELQVESDKVNDTIVKLIFQPAIGERNRDFSYRSDSVYVKQETPKLNMGQSNPETKDQNDDEHHTPDTEHIHEGTAAECDENIQNNSDDNGTDNTLPSETDDWGVVAQIRRTGIKVMAVTLAVLALGIGVRVAVLNR